MRVIAIIVSITMSLVSTTPLLATGAPQAQAAASIAGSATNASGQSMANAIVQLRDVATGQLAGTTTSTAAGQFSFTGLNPGTFSIEVVNASGQIVGASAPIGVAAGATVTGVTVTATALAATAAAAAGGALLASTVGIVSAAAVAAGVTAVVVAVNRSTASPSK